KRAGEQGRRWGKVAKVVGERGDTQVGRGAEESGEQGGVVAGMAAWQRGGVSKLELGAEAPR
ncbi:hypothetical protein B1218_35600, partial [Pseudomonas ogarae]